MTELPKNGKPNPYDVCPEYESENFHLRLVSMDDAADLLACYSDPSAQKFFNADNCTSDFLYSTLDEMRRCVEGWLQAHKAGYFFRFAIVGKKENKAIGTVEIFGGEYGVLRIDILSTYENEEYLSELLKTADSFFFDFGCENIITKAIPEAVDRIAALTSNAYTPTPIGDGNKREYYYIKR